MGRIMILLLLIAATYAAGQPAGSLPGNPQVTLSAVSEKVLLLTINERFDTTGCHDPKQYSLQSTADPGYYSGALPARIGRHSFVKTLSASGAPQIAFELYLIFDKPLKNGIAYRLLTDAINDTDGNAASVDEIFTFNDADIVGNVKVNQVGYLPDSPKLGKLGRFLGDAWFMPIDSLAPPEFQLIGSDGKIAYDGTCRYLKCDSAFSGESVFEIDFSEFKSLGQYHLYVPGYGRSPTFLISPECYDELYFNTARALFYQRSGKISAGNAGAWARDGLPATSAEIHSSHLQSPLHSASDPPPGTALPMTGGWLDAGDYGRYVPTAASALFIMFTAFELYPEKFPDSHLNIPESGNGIPDWMDEIRYETDWLMQMQAPDGGVYFRVTPATWSQGLPADEHSTLYISEKTTQSTALFVAAMAMAARNFTGFDAAYASLCLDKARKAWAFLENHPSPTPAVNIPGIAAGPYPDPIDADNRAWAAAELYKTTGETQYNAAFNEWYGKIPHQFHATMSWQQHTFKAAWAYATTTFAVNNAWVDEFKSKLNSEVLVNYYNRTMKIHAYHGAYHHFKGYVGYGTFGMAQSYAFDYILFALLLQKPELLGYAKIQLDIPLGNNPLSQTFITGAGTAPPRLPLHWSTVPGTFAEPVPGVPVFGPAASLLMNRPSSFVIQDSLNRYPYGYRKEDPYPVLRRYTDARQAVEMSEFTIQEISVTAAVFAFFSSIIAKPLPVRLQRFDAQHANCKVMLRWVTSIEHNASYFSVERSVDGKTFTAIGRIEANGYSESARAYEFEDTTPKSTNYYRLRMVDANGSSATSAIRHVRVPCKTVKWSVAPAGRGHFRLVFEETPSLPATSYVIRIYNRQGTRVISPMRGSLGFDASMLPAGVYIVRLSAAGGEDFGSRKIVIR
ncbi:MAG: glycoside hydrolase family 9 protein [Dyadobacter fermentans]